MPNIEDLLSDMRSHPFNADALLLAIRPQTEVLLKTLFERYGANAISTCTSQSLRAKRAIEAIDADLEACRNGNVKDMRRSVALFKERRQLVDFLAVHRTVCMMEWLDRNGELPTH